MSELETKKDQQPEPIEVGKRLPGLKLGNELPEDEKYWDQKLPSEFGELFYGVNQMRDGKIRWVNKDNTVLITVESGTGSVLSVSPGKSRFHPDSGGI